MPKPGFMHACKIGEERSMRLRASLPPLLIVTTERNDCAMAANPYLVPREEEERTGKAIPPRDGVSMAIWVSSRRGTASQRPFWSRPAAGRHLNGHFGLVSPRDGISTAILVSSCGMTASQWSFWSRPAAGRRLGKLEASRGGKLSS